MALTITGSTGFIGKYFLQHLDINKELVNQLTKQQLQGLLKGTPLFNALMNTQSVLHTAAIAHSAKPKSLAEEAHVFEVNTTLTLALAEQAARAGVKQFIYSSTAHVYGNSCQYVCDELRQPAPENSYAYSKFRAEEGLLKLAGQTPMRVIILRMPLVYGPGVKANFLQLLCLAHSGLPAPLGNARAKRSYLYVANLVDAVHQIIKTPDLPSGIYNISDAFAFSASMLLAELKRQMHKPLRMYALPQICMKTGLQLFGKKSIYKALYEPLLLDTTKLQTALNWQPPHATQVGLQETVNWYLNR